jgi:hypothetical protein
MPVVDTLLQTFQYTDVQRLDALNVREDALHLVLRDGRYRAIDVQCRAKWIQKDLQPTDRPTNQTNRMLSTVLLISV